MHSEYSMEFFMSFFAHSAASSFLCHLIALKVLKLSTPDVDVPYSSLSATSTIVMCAIVQVMPLVEQLNSSKTMHKKEVN